MKIKLTILLVLLVMGVSKKIFAQEVKVNNNLVVESDGTVRMDGTATVWDDINVYPDATTRSGAVPPTWNRFKTNTAGTSQGVYLYFFSVTSENELFFNVQLPHGYKVGTDLYPHVHWTTITGTPNSSTAAVTWALEYTAISIGSTFPNTSTNTSSTIIASITPSGTGQHLITSLGPISGAGLGISSILICRFYRDGDNVTDNFANTAGLLGFDIHFEQDTQGSRQEFIK